MPWGGIGNPLEGGAARVRLGSKRLASLERPIPFGPRADARVWTPCLSVIGSRRFDRSEVECHNEVPTMTSAGPDGSRTPRSTEEVRSAPVRVPDFGRNACIGRTHLVAASNHGARGGVVDRLIQVRGRPDRDRARRRSRIARSPRGCPTRSRRRRSGAPVCRKPVFREQRKLPLAGPAVGPERACQQRSFLRSRSCSAGRARLQSQPQPQRCGGADQGPVGVALVADVGAINRSEQSSRRDAEVGSQREWLRAGGNGTQPE